MKGKDIIINNVNPKIDIISPLLQWRTISTTRDADSNEEHIQFSKKDYKNLYLRGTEMRRSMKKIFLNTLVSLASIFLLIALVLFCYNIFFYQPEQMYNGIFNNNLTSVKSLINSGMDINKYKYTITKSDNVLDDVYFEIEFIKEHSLDWYNDWIEETKQSIIDFHDFGYSMDERYGEDFDRELEEFGERHNLSIEFI